MPGGYQDLGETPAECAARNFFEETGYSIRVIALLGTFSSLRYRAKINVNRGGEVTYLLFQGQSIQKGAGRESSDRTAEIDSPETSGDIGLEESSEPDPHEVDEVADVAWFSQETLPALCDGHRSRQAYAFELTASRKSNYAEGESKCQSHQE